jgi:hypothetical protein
MRPVRKEPYQDHTFALHIPLELDDDGLDFLKLKQLFLIMLDSTCLMKTSPKYTPIPQYGRALLSSIFMSPLYYLDFVICTLTSSTYHFIFFLHKDDVLRMHMRAHSILFLKTHSI